MSVSLHPVNRLNDFLKFCLQVVLTRERYYWDADIDSENHSVHTRTRTVCSDRWLSLFMFLAFITSKEK